MTTTTPSRRWYDEQLDAEYERKYAALQARQDIAERREQHAEIIRLRPLVQAAEVARGKKKSLADHLWTAVSAVIVLGGVMWGAWYLLAPVIMYWMLMAGFGR